MTPAQIRIVRQSFARIAQYPERAAVLFYDSLLDIDAAFRLRFPNPLGRRGSKLVDAVAVMVDNLHRPQMFMPALELLAARHLGPECDPSLDAVVREAVLRTVRKVLGSDSRPEIEGAWAAAYNLVAGEMMMAARVELRLAA